MNFHQLPKRWTLNNHQIIKSSHFRDKTCQNMRQNMRHVLPWYPPSGFFSFFSDSSPPIPSITKTINMVAASTQKGAVWWHETWTKNWLKSLIICWTYITGWWFQSLWKILVSWDDYSQYTGKIKAMFQTTNQIIIATVSKLTWNLPNRDLEDYILTKSR